jgi:gamma-glutamyltranspeptidase
MAMVTSPHGLASEAGREVLACGGNAIEAAVAMAAVLSVTYPHFCGIGGDAVWMIADRRGRRTCLLGIGQAISDTGRITSIDTRGPGSVLTSAAAVDAWGKAVEFSRSNWSGRMQFGDMLAPAIGYARDGFPVTRSQLHWTRFRAGEFENWPGFSQSFVTPLGQMKPGTHFRQPALAGSLSRIASHGPREFYEGELAAQIVDGLSEIGAPLSREDLASTGARWADPLVMPYKNYLLAAPPPPTQGVTTLQIMGILERTAIAQHAPTSAGFYHLVVEAVKRAFLQRGEIGDPDYCDQPMIKWLSEENLAAMAGRIDPARALNWPYPFRNGDTVFFAAVDKQGNCASVLQSTYFDWGSGVVAGDTGILWQNRGAAFNLIDGHINRLAPAKRPFYTLNPGIAFRDGNPFLLYGTQGADGQPQTLAVILSRILEYGLSPAEALAMPRFLLGRTFSDSRDSLKLEQDAGKEVFAGLAERGHEICPIEAQSALAGQAGILKIRANGTLEGCHDPRSDGIALTV